MGNWLSSIPSQKLKNYIKFGQTSICPQRLSNIHLSNQVSNDVVEIQNSGKKTKWSLGIGLAVAVTGILCCIRKGKFSKVKQLAEHIDFKPANTIEEAAEFAKTHLGIKKFKIQNLELANYSNEAFVEASNKCKGKIKLPTKVSEKKLDSLVYARAKTNILGEAHIQYNSEFFKDPLKFVNEEFMDDCRKNINLFTSSETKELFGKYFHGTLSYKEKLSLRELQQNILMTFQAKSLDEVLKFSPPSAFITVFHELGHINHRANIGLLKYVSTPNYKLFKNKKVENMPKALQEYLKFKDKIECEVSWYAAEDPAEYVAEMFAGLVSGEKYPQEFMDLYQKYGGPMISG